MLKDSQWYAGYRYHEDYLRDLKTGKAEEYFLVERRVVVPHYMINIVTTLNAVKLLSYTLGWNACRKWHNGEVVGTILGAIGAIGGGKTTWLHIMLCLYLMGWNHALECIKQEERSRGYHRPEGYTRRATLHSMPNRVAIRDLLSISGRI